jgi:hypothetical protein
MPMAPMPRTIENPAFTFQATFKVEGRTLKIHREFVSRAAGRCARPNWKPKSAAT